MIVAHLYPDIDGGGCAWAVDDMRRACGASYRIESGVEAEPGFAACAAIAAARKVGARVWPIALRDVRADGSLVTADVYSADGWRVWNAIRGRGDACARWDAGARIPLRERRRAETMLRRALREDEPGVIRP